MRDLIIQNNIDIYFYLRAITFIALISYCIHILKYCKKDKIT